MGDINETIAPLPFGVQDFCYLLILRLGSTFLLIDLFLYLKFSSATIRGSVDSLPLSAMPQTQTFDFVIVGGTSHRPVCHVETCL